MDDTVLSKFKKNAFVESLPKFQEIVTSLS